MANIFEQYNRFLTESAEALERVPDRQPVVRQTCDQLKDTLRQFSAGMKQVLDDNALLCIGVVGQMKAGKSSFLNSLLFNGQTVLPIAATPMTAGLTTLEYTPGPNQLEICYYSREDWNTIKKEANDYREILEGLLKEKPELAGKDMMIRNEMKKRTTEAQRSSVILVDTLRPEAAQKIGSEPATIGFDDIQALQDRMRDLVGAGGRYTSVVSMLNIRLNDPRLQGYRIVDTPGVNDPVVSRERRTHEFLHQCHGVFMLSRADHFMGNSDSKFIDERLASVGISAILLIVSQFDTVIRNPQYANEMSLSEAVRITGRELKGQFEDIRQGLSPKISAAFCGCAFSSGMAEAVLTKLKKAGFTVADARLDSDETTFFNSLSKDYPDDFSSPDKIEASLNLLADFDNIRRIIKTNFKDCKDKIIASKVENYFTEQENAIRLALDSASDKLKSELEFLRSTDYDRLRKDVEALRQSVDYMIVPLQIVIDSYSVKLKNKVADIKEHRLDSVKVNCGEVPVSAQCVYYTRESTFWGITKNGHVGIEAVNRPSAKEDQKNKMNRYRVTVDKTWSDIFVEFQEDMLGKMVEKISELSATLASCSMMLSNVLDRTFNVELEGCRQLSLVDKYDALVSDMESFVDENRHTSFKTSFGSMEDSEADALVREEARDKLATVKYGLQSRDTAFMKEMKEIVTEEYNKVSQILLRLRETLATSIKESIDSVLNEKTQQLSNKDATINDFTEALGIIQNIKRQMQ